MIAVLAEWARSSEGEVHVLLLLVFSYSLFEGVAFHSSPLLVDTLRHRDVAINTSIICTSGVTLAVPHSLTVDMSSVNSSSEKLTQESTESLIDFHCPQTWPWYAPAGSTPRVVLYSAALCLF